MSNTILKQIQRSAKEQNMDFEDFLYYHIKELRQEVLFWNEQAQNGRRGARVRFRKLEDKLRDTVDIQNNLN